MCCSLKSLDRGKSQVGRTFVTAGHMFLPLPVSLSHQPLIPPTSMVVPFLTEKLCCEFVTAEASMLC